jgi:hypothetical protein
VATDNEQVLAQIKPAEAYKIACDEKLIRIALDSGYDYSHVQAIESQNNRRIAEQKVTVGGGCLGENDTEFRGSGGSGGGSWGSSEDAVGSQESRVGKIKRGKCVIESCPTRPKEVKVGGCGVCLERCQVLFDKGQDPSKMLPIIRRAVQRKSDSHEFSLSA